MKRFRWISAGVITMAALVAGVMMTQASCGQTPVNVPVRTFEGAGRMDVLCMQVLSTDPSTSGTPIPAVPVPLDNCGPVATGTDTTQLFFHLVAVVTQTFRGELAVVDLTAGHVVDTSRSLPGVNFLPVGQNPTDVVVTPDANRVFVSAAETNKPAIYEIPSTRLLGDSAILAEPTQAAEQTALPSWPSCGLPQAPGRMVVVPTGAVPSGGDAGDGGVAQGYEIVVVMPGNGTDEQALAGVIDVAAFDSIPAGSLSPCPIKALVHLDENPSALPKSWTPGPQWPLGLPYHDAGVDLFTTANPSNNVQPSTAYKLPLWQCPQLAHADGGEAGVPDASPIRLEPGAQAHATGMATDGRYVWVADQATPFIHVLDTTVPGTLTELAPLVATSMVDPTRTVTTSELAISPTTRDYKRYLYAVDAKQGSVMIYDVTDPANGPRLPMTRPNPELAPNQAPDRILFPAPVATFTFARHDFAVPGASGPVQTGLLCNPNPNAGTSGNGVEYRANGPLSVALGPKRLRGVFGFATLTNGQVIAVDVDDWDAPCRRPVALGANQTGSLALPEPTPFGSSDIDPYHAPSIGDAGTATDAGLFTVSNESMWPIIQPNRIRSLNNVEDDTIGTNGLHNPAARVGAAAPRERRARLHHGQARRGAHGGVAGRSRERDAVEPGGGAQRLHRARSPGRAHRSDVERHLRRLDPRLRRHRRDDREPQLHVARALELERLLLRPRRRGSAPRLAALRSDAGRRRGARERERHVHAHPDAVRSARRRLHPDSPTTSSARRTSSTPVRRPRPTIRTGTKTTRAGPASPTPAATTSPTRRRPRRSRQQVCFNKFGTYGADQNTQRDFPILEAFEDHVVARPLPVPRRDEPSVERPRHRAAGHAIAGRLPARAVLLPRPGALPRTRGQRVDRAREPHAVPPPRRRRSDDEVVRAVV